MRRITGSIAALLLCAVVRTAPAEDAGAGAAGPSGSADGGTAPLRTPDGSAPLAVVPIDAGTRFTSESLPDPKPTVTRQQWVLDLQYRHGEPRLLGVRKVILGRAAPTARLMGRFALELYVGKELIDRARFDFPLLGGGDYNGPTALSKPPEFEPTMTTSTSVMIPQSERATRLYLVDRALNRVWELPWPLPTRTAG